MACMEASKKLLIRERFVTYLETHTAPPVSVGGAGSGVEFRLFLTFQVWVMNCPENFCGV